MNYEWDDKKCNSNLKNHKVDFSAVEGFDWQSALIIEDNRRDYGETRYRAMGLIGSRLHALMFAARGEKVRVISLRKANRREVKNYEEKI